MSNRPITSCIFCGAKDLTKEHILGQWTRKLPGWVAEARSFHVSRTPIYHEDGSAELQIGTRWRNGHARSQTLKIVCKACNGGWLSNIQEAAKPHLKRLFFSRSINSNIEAARKLAMWVAMVIMTSEYRERKIVVTTHDERCEFKNNLHPPLHWKFYISFTNLRKRDGTIHHQALQLATSKPVGEFDPTIRYSTIVFGPVIFVCFSNRSGYPDEFDSIAKKKGMLRLWPFPEFMSNSTSQCQIRSGEIYNEHDFVEFTNLLHIESSAIFANAFTSKRIQEIFPSTNNFNITEYIPNA